MIKQIRIAATLATVTFGFTATVTAQDRSSVSPAELNAAVTARPSAKGDVVREILSGDQARKVAASMGVSADELASRVEALDGATLDRLAEQAGVSEATVMRRANVVISTTAIIIILLLLILLTS